MILSTIIPESPEGGGYGVTGRLRFPPKGNDGQGRSFYFADSPFDTTGNEPSSRSLRFALAPCLPTIQFGHRRFSCDEFLGRRERANLHWRRHELEVRCAGSSSEARVRDCPMTS